MSATPTSDLAAFVAGLRLEDVPSRVRERAKDILLDSVGSAIAGHHGDETAQVTALARTIGASEESTVIGGSGLSAAGATLVNGYLMTAVTVCDVHRPTLCHVSPEVVPPALATAERLDVSGRALLLAIIAGLETTTRVGLGTNYPAFRSRGWHSPGVIGPFGGAAAVGKLIGLSAVQQRNAFGLAGSQSAGTFAHWGTPTIKFHQSRAALSGLMAGILAGENFTSSQEILAHPDGGIFNAYSDGGSPAAVVAELGDRWELENISLRLWPAASSIQSVVTAMFALIDAHDLRPEHVARIRVGLSETVYKMHGELGWDDKFRALLSTRYATAVVLHDRRCWLEQFTSERIRDAATDRFAREKVMVEIDPTVDGTGARVEVTMADGRVLLDNRPVPRGDASDPLSRDDIITKFRTASADRLPGSQADEAIDLLANIEQVDRVSTLCAALRAPVPVSSAR
ncbi:MAG: MmgE/PrpD family protein [Chloroflexi bacterium]|nr:MmgE/PrpD family protein [Chloroflexota bacterium]